MIIVSQDRKAIHNFNNILSLQVEIYYNESHKEEDHVYRIVVYDNLNDHTGLGDYKTEERAKEVLDEIIDTYTGVRAIENYVLDLNFNENTQMRIRPKMFYMPEE